MRAIGVKFFQMMKTREAAIILEDNQIITEGQHGDNKTVRIQITMPLLEIETTQICKIDNLKTLLMVEDSKVDNLK